MCTDALLLGCWLGAAAWLVPLQHKQFPLHLFFLQASLPRPVSTASDKTSAVQIQHVCSSIPVCMPPAGLTLPGQSKLPALSTTSKTGHAAGARRHRRTAAMHTLLGCMHDPCVTLPHDTNTRARIAPPHAPLVALVRHSLQLQLPCSPEPHACGQDTVGCGSCTACYASSPGPQLV